MQLRRAVLLSALAAGDLAALVRLLPQTPGALAVATRPHAELARLGPDAALATLAGGALWCAAAWLATGLTAAAAARLPGWGGRCAGALARVLLPGALRRIVVGGAGLGVLLAPAAALASTPTSVPARASAPASMWASTDPPPMSTPAPRDPAPTPGAAVTSPAPAWPVEPSGSPAPVWPSAPAPGPTQGGHPTPANHPPPAGHPGAANDPAPADGTGRTDRVTVRPGDSLWSIAARSLGPGAPAPRVAAEWPRWFAVNRAAIGDDPALIRPGEVLRPPGPAATTEEARP